MHLQVCPHSPTVEVALAPVSESDFDIHMYILLFTSVSLWYVHDTIPLCLVVPLHMCLAVLMCAAVCKYYYIPIQV